MTLRVAINGFGRIGRNFMRCWLSRGANTGIEVVGLNDTSDPKTNAHLLQYDTMPYRRHDRGEWQAHQMFL
jgi:glyceraldehyde-3-phosphate dehydrogenase (NAD(P))